MLMEPFWNDQTKERKQTNNSSTNLEKDLVWNLCRLLSSKPRKNLNYSIKTVNKTENIGTTIMSTTFQNPSL